MSENKIKISSTLIENRIFTLRGEQVMLDFHLAELYQVETKRLNEQVKRNSKRFPESFMFQISDAEWVELQSQIATAEKIKGLQSQIATAKRRTLPFVFTEQGVSMLSAVLNSDIAIEISIQIMNAFVQMRKTIGNHQQLLELSNNFNQHKLETNQKFEQVFKALEAPEIQNKQGVFFNGQTYDAYAFVNKLIKKAKQSIVIIDNYIDDSVITQLTKKQKNVSVYLLCKTISKKLQLDIDKANTQYPSFKAIPFAKAHDRFVVIDQKEVFHIGASLKDLGEKWFAFSKLENDSLTILQTIKELI
jgi:ORF6N domain-containing protein